MNGDNSLSNYANTLGQLAGSIWGKPAQTTVINPPSAQPQSSMNWTPFAIGGGILVLVIAVIAVLGGRGR